MREPRLSLWRLVGVTTVAVLLVVTAVATVGVWREQRSDALAVRQGQADRAGAALASRLEVTVRQVRAVNALSGSVGPADRRAHAAFADAVSEGADRLALTWSRRARGAAPRTARDAGRPRIVGPVRLQRGRGRGLLVIEPLYRGMRRPATVFARRAAHVGFVVGVVRLDVLLAEVGAVLPDRLRLSVLERERRLGGAPRSRGAAASAELPSIAGRTWRVEVSGPLPPAWPLPAGIAGIGLGLAALVSTLVLLGGRRERSARSTAARRRAEREEAISARRASEERFRTVVESASDAIVLCDARGRVVSWNRAAARMLGHRAARIIGRPVGVLLPRGAPGERARVLESLRVSAEGRQVGQAIELDLRRRDGTPVPVELTLASWAGGDGRLYSGILRDVSERRATQGELTRGRNFLEATLASLSEGVIACDADGEIVMANRALREIQGLGDAPLAEQATALRARLRHADGVTPMADDELPLTRALAGESLEQIETLVVDDGRRRRVLASGEPILDTDGRRLGAVVSLLDVTERAAVAEALRRERDFSTSLVAALQDGVMTVGADGRVEHVTPRFCAMTGFDREEMVGAAPPYPHGPVDGTQALADFRTALLGGRPGELDATLRRKDGRRFSALLSGSPRRGPGGEVKGYVVTVKDITERARVEAGQAALRRVATAVAADEEPAAVLGLVAGEAARLLGGDAAVVLRFAPDRAEVMGAWAAEGPAPPRGGTIPVTAEGVGTLVRATGRPARWAADGLPPAPGSYRSSVGTPVRLSGRVWGTVAVASRRAEAFEPGAEGVLGRFAEITTLALAHADSRRQLVEQASTDHLTGLANRRAFQERLDVEVQRARRHGRPLGLAILDIDHFKRVNDARGHQAGDDVLREFARRLAAVVRAGEMLARVGGEEFAWLLPEADGMDAFVAAERGRAAVAATPFPGAGPITASAGVAELPEAGDGANIFQMADTALYWAKGEGRNRVVRCPPDGAGPDAPGQRGPRFAPAEAAEVVD